MSTSTHVVPAAAGRPETASTDSTRRGARRRSMLVTAVVTAASLGLLVDLLLAGHTSGEEIWGPVTAAAAAAVGALSLVYLHVRGRNRLARYMIYGLWGMVAFFGFGGYNDHRLPVPADVVDSRSRPPLAPLVFTGLAVAAAVTLRSGTKER
jgi:hypothetical protein